MNKGTIVQFSRTGIIAVDSQEEGLKSLMDKRSISKENNEIKPLIKIRKEVKNTQGRRRRYGRSGHGRTTFLAENCFGRTTFSAEYDSFFLRVIFSAEFLNFSKAMIKLE